MKNKLTNIIMLLSIVFLTTGCVKFNTNMDIHKDKSMDLEIIYAIDSTYFQDEELFDETDKEKLSNKGYKIEDYTDGTMNGVKLSLSIANIDKISISENTTYNVSNLLDTESNEAIKNVFTVKKGLLKNEYKAKFEFDSSDSDLNTDNDDSDINFDDDTEDDLTDNDIDFDFDFDFDDEDITFETDDDEETLTDSDFDLDGLEDLSNTMDLSFNVNLPYKALSNNATEVTNDGKNLKWSLTTDEVSYIEFSFALYNYTNIYIGVGIIAVLIILLIVFILSKKKKDNSKNDNNSNNVVNSNGVNNVVADTTNVVNPSPMMNQTNMMNSNSDVVNQVPVQQPINVMPNTMTDLNNNNLLQDNANQGMNMQNNVVPNTTNVVNPSPMMNQTNMMNSNSDVVNQVPVQQPINVMPSTMTDLNNNNLLQDNANQGMNMQNNVVPNTTNVVNPSLMMNQTNTMNSNSNVVNQVPVQQPINVIPNTMNNLNNNSLLQDNANQGMNMQNNVVPDTTNVVSPSPMMNQTNTMNSNSNVVNQGQNNIPNQNNISSMNFTNYNNQ